MENNDKKIQLALNQTIFTRSLIALLCFINKKSCEYIENLEKQNNDISPESEKYKNHKNLQLWSEKLVESLNKTTTSESTGKLLKKIYKNICENYEMILNRDKKVFKIINENKEIITIIPGININMIISLCSDDDINMIFDDLYKIFIAATYIINDIKTVSKENLDKANNLRKILTDNSENDAFFNPFIGMDGCDGNVSIETFLENIKKYNDKNEGPNKMSSGFVNDMVNNILNIESLSSLASQFDDETIEQATDVIQDILHINKDDESKKLFGDVVKNVIGELKNTDSSVSGLNFQDIAMKVAKNMNSNGKDMQKYKKNFEKSIMNPNMMKEFEKMGQGGENDIGKMLSGLNIADLIGNIGAAASKKK